MALRPGAEGVARGRAGGTSGTPSANALPTDLPGRLPGKRRYRAIMPKPDRRPRPATVVRPSLCHSCAFVRNVSGKHGQTYFLCENDEIAEKYLPQPVLRCSGYMHAAREQ